MSPERLETRSSQTWLSNTSIHTHMSACTSLEERVVSPRKTPERSRWSRQRSDRQLHRNHVQEFLNVSFPYLLCLCSVAWRSLCHWGRRVFGRKGNTSVGVRTLWADRDVLALAAILLPGLGKHNLTTTTLLLDETLIVTAKPYWVEHLLNLRKSRGSMENGEIV